jgi:gallate decarboxylase subunit D
MTQQPLLFQSEKSGYKVEALCKKMGDDILLSIWGGVAHIGAVAMAQPRASLKDPAKRSATASVFSYVGHKEDQLVKAVSERMASELDAKVVVAAGLHWDHITPSGIEQIICNVNDLVTEIIQEINST